MIATEKERFQGIFWYRNFYTPSKIDVKLWVRSLCFKKKIIINR